MALSGKQEEELRLSLLDYLQSAGLQQSFDALLAESGLADTYVADGKQKYSGLLEKKWTSVVRLQKKIIELEAKVESLEGTASSKPAAASNINWVPKAPAKFSLSGHRSPITGLSFHPTFSILASGSEDASIKIWDYESGEFERTLKGHTKAVNAVAFDTFGKNTNLLASGSADLSIKIWDSQQDYSCIKTLFGHDDSVSSVAFILPGDFIVSASKDKTIKIWELSTGYCVKTLHDHDDWVRAVVACEDGKTIASCSSDQSVRIWDIASGDCINVLKEHSHVVECVAFAPIAAGAAVKELAGFDAKSIKEATLPGQFVASGSRDKTIKIWDATTGMCLYTLEGHDNWVRSLAFHPNGKYLFSSSDDKAIRVWDLQTGRCYRTLDAAHTQFISCLAVHGTLPIVASGSVDQSVKVWVG